MKRLILTLLFVLLLGSIITTGQQFNEAQAPQEVKTQLQDLRDEIKSEGFSFTVGYNAAMQYSISQLCGLKEPADWFQKAKEKAISVLKPEMLRSMETEAALPVKWDWRDSGDVTVVKDQGGCGSCWAFSAMGGMEAYLLIKQDSTTDLSEQYLVSCNTQGWGCNGGWWPHDMLVNPGAVLESDFPYQATDAPCGGPYNYPHQITGWAYVDGQNQVPATDKIKQAIYDYGPVSAAVYVGSAFQAYTGNVFDKDETPSGGFCGCTPPSKVNHAILLVGWDDSKQAWILKNSWGTGWGDSGYMLIKYGTSNVGYAAVITY